MKAAFTGVLLGFFILPGAVFASEHITSFDARITVESDASVQVQEQIVYDFGGLERHGIFRNIPYSYQASSTTYTAPISNVMVTDEQGVPRPFNESRTGGELVLKIGDPDVTVTGEHTYVISYAVKGPFLYFTDRDEFYWNVVGSWTVPIQQASVLVDLPIGVLVLDAACYQGARGGVAACDEGTRLVSNERAGYHAVANDLATGEGFSVAVAFPKGTIAVVQKPWEKAGEQSRLDYWPFAIPLSMFFAMAYLWYTRGRDPAGRVTIVTQFEPPQGVLPGVAGVVYNERIEPREISAEIVRLAVEGYVKIHQIEKEILIFTSTDYLIEATHGEKRPNDPVALALIQKLFQQSFMGSAEVNGKEVEGVLVSKMQHNFVGEVQEIEDVLYNEVYEHGYFIERPDKVRTRYSVFGFLATFAGIGYLFWQNGQGESVLVAVGALLSGILITLWGRIMPAKTREGVRIKEHLEGFKRYLSVAEKDRIAFHNAPERTPELFSTFLPYAMAFGVEKEWAKQFEGLFEEQPSWYTGPNGAHFAPAAFASSLSTFASDFRSASMPSSSGSSGGGSVGGGFGGGGGGSW